jgi:hypothetical protein
MTQDVKQLTLYCFTRGASSDDVHVLNSFEKGLVLTRPLVTAAMMTRPKERIRPYRLQNEAMAAVQLYKTSY